MVGLTTEIKLTCQRLHSREAHPFPGSEADPAGAEGPAGGTQQGGQLLEAQRLSNTPISMSR
jgi:hypothetical protein